MRKLYLLLIFLLPATATWSQTDQKRGTVFFEAGGNGLIASLNYEFLITRQRNFGFRAGIGYAPINEGYIIVPFGVDYLFKLGTPGSFLDAGFGATWTKNQERFYYGYDDYYETDSPMMSYIPSLGFRRHTSKNWMWRISGAGVFNRDGASPWLGFSIGKRF
jgi:hypothetical protein